MFETHAQDRARHAKHLGLFVTWATCTPLTVGEELAYSSATLARPA
jgi:hypothetical protein